MLLGQTPLIIDANTNKSSHCEQLEQTNVCYFAWNYLKLFSFTRRRWLSALLVGNLREEIKSKIKLIFFFLC